MKDISDSKKISWEAFSTSLDKTDEDFALKFHKQNNTFASKIQMHFFLHNATYFEYGATVTGKC